jgi:hypothetical protein
LSSINNTEAIKNAQIEIWDSDVRNNQFWRQNNLLDEHGNEIYKQTLYVHVMKNDSSLDIYDNNGTIGLPGGRNGTKNPRIICHSNSYMIKFGKTDNQKGKDNKWKGILNRRQDDFKNHYHKREDINHPFKVSFNPKNQNSNSSARIGSSSTLLHLIINLNGKETEEIRRLESQLKDKFIEKFINEVQPYFNSIRIPIERINIPIESVNNDEEQLINYTKNLFRDFENNNVV